MAEGNPVLAVWSVDSTLRTYELGEGGFAQIASAGLSNNELRAGFLPNLRFIRDSTLILFRNYISDNGASLTTRTPSLIAGAGPTNVPAAGGGQGLVKDVYSDLDQCVYSVYYTSGVMAAITSIGADGSLTAKVGSFSPASNRAINDVSLSPDGKIAVRGSSINNSDYYLRDNAAPIGSPTFNGRFPLPVTGAVMLMRWSADSRYLITGDWTGGITLLKRDGDVISKLTELNEGTLRPMAIAISPNTRIVAVGWAADPNIHTGIPITVLYRRIGPFLQKIQTLPGTVGSRLSFTADGLHLIDAVNKRAFKKDEGADTFTEVVGMMSNVAAGGRSQTISTHLISPKGTLKFYNGAVADLTLGRTSIGSLKLALLSGNAAFNQAHTTLAQVTANAANEVAQYGWPSGGKSLPNARFIESTTDTLALDFDKLTQIIVENDLTFRYGVIYDNAHADKKPLAFVDFQKEMRGGRNSELTFDFREVGLVLFSA